METRRPSGNSTETEMISVVIASPPVTDRTPLVSERNVSRCSIPSLGAVCGCLTAVGFTALMVYLVKANLVVL